MPTYTFHSWNEYREGEAKPFILYVQMQVEGSDRFEYSYETEQERDWAIARLGEHTM